MAYTNSALVLSMQSAIAAAKTITAATNANPGVFTSATHGYIDGDIVLLRVQGMTKVNMRLFEIVNKAVDTFQLKNSVTGTVGVDTTDFGIFSTGTAEKITFGTTLSGVTNFSSSGGEIKFVDSTEVSDDEDKETSVGSTASRYNMTVKWNPSDAGQIALKSASTLRQSRAFKIKWPDGRYAMFYGTVGFSGMPGGENQGLTTTQAAFSMEGGLTTCIP